MDPYLVLGVGPGATAAEIEDSYRRLLRAHHPDLHQGKSPATLAEAGTRTRELNEAMAVIRAGWQPIVDEVDWFGHPMGPRRAESVDCPICGDTFTDSTTYRSHLSRRHHLTADAAAAPPAERRDRLRWLTWIPAPTFWLIFALLLYWAFVVRVIAWPYDIAGIWAGVFGFGYLYPRAIRDRRVW